MTQCGTSGVSSVDTGITHLFLVLPSPPGTFRVVQADRIPKDMTRRVLRESLKLALKCCWGDILCREKIPAQVDVRRR